MTRVEDLQTRLQDPGFTPGRRDVPGLLELLGLADDDEPVLRALARLGAEAKAPVVARFDGAAAPLRARLVRLYGRLAREHPEDDAWRWLEGRLDDGDPKARRNALIALKHGPPTPEREALLLGYWSREARPEHRRTVADALGALGGQRSVALLEAWRGDDPQLQKIITRTLLRLRRDARRGAGSSLHPERRSRGQFTARLWHRAGLERVTEAFLPKGWRLAGHRGPGALAVTLEGSLTDLLAVRTARWFGVELTPVALSPREELADTVARVLASEEARKVFSTWTAGVPRVRIAVGQGGHPRKLLWAIAERLEKLTRSVVNDPRESTWEAVVSEYRGTLQVVLSPHAMADPRFPWRLAQVPASSHPTVAAALALVAGVRPGEVVWDPFVGAGAELVERSLLGPWTRMVGTDRDPTALEAARTNLQAAGVEGVALLQQDARDTQVEGLTLALTNPPLGSRVGFGEEVPALLEAMVPRIARQLRPGGRLVWLSPVPERTRAAAQRAGLRVTWDQPVSLEGLVTALQRFDR